MGLDPEVQTATAQKSTIDRQHNAHIALGVVNNIVVRIAGNAPDHARRPALLLATSYDTSERSVGAASSAAPVAALLETLRVLQSGAPLANDLVVLFADGERVGGLGARAFAGQHPLAKQAGLVIRFDGGGSRGPLVLIGASGDARAAVRGWARAAPHAYGSSFMQAVYRMMRARWRWARSAARHRRACTSPIWKAATASVSVRATRPAGVDPGTVQNMGDTMVALARHFGQAPPAPDARRRGRVFQPARHRRGGLFGRRGLDAHAAGLPDVPHRLLHGGVPRRRRAGRHRLRRVRASCSSAR